MLYYRKNIPIKFYIGDENRLVIESEYKDDSIFANQYNRAIDILRTFMSGEKEENEQPVSNVIAFCGERGEGKTSCMFSLQNQLPKAFDNETFDILNPIDPSFFDDKHNILELFLGQLYNRFINARGYNDERPQILESFNNVKNCLRTLTKGTENVYDAIEELDELSCSVTLKTHLGELIDNYLKYVGKEYLLVVIDDMDYNWRGAYEMTQMIYKYLSHHNCILFISVSISQMVEVIETSLKNQLGSVGGLSNFFEIANKYIEKLIPLQNRIEMPHVYDLCDRRLEVYSNREDKKPILKYDSIKEGVVNEIFIKTRYLFYNYQDGVSQIVPRNLRMLRQLLGMLNGMDIYHKDSVDPVEREAGFQNKLNFQSYFLTNWTRQLTSQHQNFIKTVMRIQDVSQVNKMVVSYLKNMLPEGGAKLFADITEESNYSYNISLGDVFTMLNFIERNPKDDNDQLMIFFLKSYYSMLMYHYYDEITEDVRTLVLDKRQIGIYRKDSWFKGTNKLQRFVNGAYFQYNHGDLLKGWLHDAGINNVLICDKFGVGKKFVEDYFKNVALILDKKDEDLTKDDKDNVNLVELFILMTLWGSEFEEKSHALKRRDYPQPYHLLRFSKNTVLYMFDIMAPFTNLINLHFAYDRFSELTGDLYQYAYSREWSLLRQMMSEVGNGERVLKKQELSLASDAIFRNAEVLTSMKEKIMSIASTGDNAFNIAIMIAEFYEKILDSEMVTYPTASGEEPYTINFRFLKPVCRLLKATASNVFYTYLLNLQILEERGRYSSSSSEF